MPARGGTGQRRWDHRRFLSHERDRAAPLLTRGFPIVRLEATRKAAGPLPLDSIYVDSVAGARTAVTYLIERGHRRIAMISGQSGPHPARLRGYREALEVHGLAFTDALVASGDFRERGGYHAMRRLLALTPRPTAVFAANDEMAMGALLALGEAGVAVPGELAVVGFDDIPIARLTNPPLTTVAQFQYRLGQRAAELLLERLAGTAPPRAGARNSRTHWWCAALPGVAGAKPATRWKGWR